MSRFEYRDGRFYKDGAPHFLIAAEYMYFRESPANWEDRLQKLKDSGVNCIVFYFCWRHHLQFENGQRFYDFTGKTKDSRNVVDFMKAIQAKGLQFIAKPGPFIHSELNVGGLPDLVCPKFCPETPPARRYHGRPVIWEYDATPLPAPFDERFDNLCKEWLEAVHEVLAPFCGEEGPCIAIQMNDETIYCMSNSPPWNVAYEPTGIRFYHQLLADRYGDITTYNKLHGTSYAAFSFIPGPQLPTPDAAGAIRSREDMLKFVDWAELQWRYRRDLYVRYTEYLGIQLPFMTNYAGITPPIEENVPDKQEEASEPLPPDFVRLYAEWWFAHNRIETDAKDYEYGMISWLGVASYERDVFDRYINTARRSRGINMEENWGFGTLYDAKSRYPLIPFYQTLVSVAGGATGYNIFCGVSTDYWDDALDRTTKKQHPTFPSHGPIDEHGNCRPMYYTAQMLNQWFEDNGTDLLRAKIDIDAGYLLYAPYAAVSSWVPNEKYWKLGDAIPRCGCECFEPFSKSLQQAGFSFGMFELEPASAEQMQSCEALAIHTAFYMDEPAQRKLADYIQQGGRLFISGDLPTVDLRWQPCTVLKEAVEKAVKAGNGRVVFRKENFFADGKFADAMMAAGLSPKVRYSDNMRAYVHRGEDDYFVFFFSFDLNGQHDKWIEFYGQRVDLRLGSKTSGVLRIRGGKLVSWVVKGENEVENLKDEIRIQYKDQVLEHQGDFSSRGV